MPKSKKQSQVGTDDTTMIDDLEWENLLQHIEELSGLEVDHVAE